MSEEDNVADMAKDLQIKDDPFINILLLGETGVGKSTFINSIVNYLTYPEFEIAAQENLITLITSQFTVQDKNGEYHEVEVGSRLEDDKNECLDVGMSATQDVKSYVFPIWNGALKVRLIDTPGIGDGRGIDQDDMNCERILSYIGQFHELHAICYLFKPTNSRITVYFEYCMTQILSRLEKSASRNMIFIFTNARGTDYTPGETYPILKKVVADIKARPPYVDIPLGKNVFCFDNEAFRYLTAIKQNIEFNPRTAQRNQESWTWSVEQCNNLIEYIIGDSKNPPLQPHIIKNTNAINEARRLIIQLSRPLAEISQLISDNVFALQRHKEDLDMSYNTIDELKKKLYMPVIDLEVMELSQPVTICTSKNCAEIYKVGELNKYHYKQRCHDPCFLRNVPKEIIGSPELLHCAAINSSTKACIQCRCDFSTHMHIYYLSKTVENKVVDKNIQKNINNKTAVLENCQMLIKHISTRKNELDEEHNIITKTCAKFAHFLQNNTITPFSDSYKEYIEYLITREKSLGKLAKKAIVDHLEKTL
ncbi:uncharacterized protein LOC108905327 [Anoplophora glabripennis]|uniref:uncharacterized protein LOC108905327 n=1 Tax=Anoplophora glabripennis TaxID=217634 RepID=UPI0008750F2D|nr:uncharacterized protein LOC108905327 [Anoplophora glabripennis]